MVAIVEPESDAGELPIIGLDRIGGGGGAAPCTGTPHPTMGTKP